ALEESQDLHREAVLLLLIPSLTRARPARGGQTRLPTQQMECVGYEAVGYCAAISAGLSWVCIHSVLNVLSSAVCCVWKKFSRPSSRQNAADTDTHLVYRLSGGKSSKNRKSNGRNGGHYHIILCKIASFIYLFIYFIF
ncbi:hypothetical protein AMEX_G13620, partial [Astyanax mexicanus]